MKVIVILIAIVAESDSYSDGDRTQGIKEVQSGHQTFSRSTPCK